jgi:Calcineurin-like phosphoesterase
MRKGLFLLLFLVLGWTLLWAQAAKVEFIFTSDVHYGITRAAFRGGADVDAKVVNAAMVKQINRMPEAVFPKDGGNGADQSVGSIDFVAIGGDITNRQESSAGKAIQSSAVSWSQFKSAYIDGLKLHDRTGGRTPVYVVPGNHDVSNAIGYFKPLSPLTDKTSLTEIYNLMIRPATPKTPATYEYPRDKMLASRDISGVHLLFITMWPDSSVRAWMENDLKSVSANTPVIIFAHDYPDGDPIQFINPNGNHDINSKDGFENLLSDVFADGAGGGKKSDTPAPLIEQRAWQAFLTQHPNITAYFHGHSNWNQFYDWTGPDHTIVLHSFRADSPMKGHFSGPDETKLSFQIATIDMPSRTMTVREVLWNANPKAPDAPVGWGGSTTVALAPRPLAKK